MNYATHLIDVSTDPDTVLTAQQIISAAVAASSGLAEIDIDTIAELNAILTDADLVTQARSVAAGTGLSGGGNLSADRTISLQNTAVTPGDYTAASITVDAQGRITAAASGSFAPTSRSVAAGTGLTGGGDLSADRTVALSTANVDKLATITVTADKVTVDRAFAPGLYDHTIATGETDSPPAGAIFRSTVDGKVYHRLADGSTNQLDNDVPSEYGGVGYHLGWPYKASRYYHVNGLDGTSVALVNTRVYYVPFTVHSSSSWSGMGLLRVGGSTTNARLGVYAVDLDTGLPTGTPLASAIASLEETSGDAVFGSALTLPAGLYYLAVLVESSVSVVAVSSLYDGPFGAGEIAHSENTFCYQDSAVYASGFPTAATGASMVCLAGPAPRLSLKTPA